MPTTGRCTYLAFVVRPFLRHYSPGTSPAPSARYHDCAVTMSGFKDLAKRGWHPGGGDKSKNNGGKEGWRGDFKGMNTVVCPTVFTSLRRHPTEYF
jgi:hypothetical protein